MSKSQINTIKGIVGTSSETLQARTDMQRVTRKPKISCILQSLEFPYATEITVICPPQRRLKAQAWHVAQMSRAYVKETVVVLLCSMGGVSCIGSESDSKTTRCLSDFIWASLLYSKLSVKFWDLLISAFAQGASQTGYNRSSGFHIAKRKKLISIA